MRVSSRKPHASQPTDIKPPAVDREFVQGFERGVAVIKAFSARRPVLTVTQVAQHTGLARAVARRYLLTLERLGYVAQEESGFALTPRVLELGFAYLSTLSVAEVARPVMLDLVDTLHESCSLAVLDGEDVVYVARVQAQRIMTTNIVVGFRLPAHATSLGKVLLAYLPPEKLDAFFAASALKPMTERTIVHPKTLRTTLATVRQRGWAENDQESEKGVRTLAVPIFDRHGSVVAAMNLSAHATRVTMRGLRNEYLPVLAAAADRISHALGATNTSASIHESLVGRKRKAIIARSRGAR